MSNVQVGTIYQQVISKVIEASENDFLENGVDQALLQELREGWQKRLTDLKGANYPWDPTPTVPPQPPTVPSNVPKVENTGERREQNNRAYNGQQIKQEVKVENYDGSANGQAPAAYSQSGLDRNIASNRAAELLRQQYGTQAAQSIASMNNQTGQNPAMQQQNQQRVQNMPPGAQQRQQPPMNLQMPTQRQQQHNLYQAQNDGAADDWTDHKIKIEGAGEAGRHAADGLIRNHIQAMSQHMDSGLMVPLNEQPSKRKKSKFAARRPATIAEAAEASAREPHISQLDGLSDDDDDTKDEDAINSDLDDSDEGDHEEDDDSAEIGDIMLCTYDKVQRVKNKWKCVLKDGILTTNGKDYVFHKATGEFEW